MVGFGFSRSVSSKSLPTGEAETSISHSLSLSLGVYEGSWRERKSKFAKVWKERKEEGEWGESPVQPLLYCQGWS